MCTICRVFQSFWWSFSREKLTPFLSNNLYGCLCFYLVQISQYPVRPYHYPWKNMLLTKSLFLDQLKRKIKVSTVSISKSVKCQIIQDLCIFLVFSGIWSVLGKFVIEFSKMKNGSHVLFWDIQELNGLIWSIDICMGKWTVGIVQKRAHIPSQ